MPRYNKDKEAIARLTPEQFRVTQQNATERPFQNTFWDHDEHCAAQSGQNPGKTLRRRHTLTAWK